MSNTQLFGLLFPIGLSGFHLAITLLALYRARKALGIAGREGRGDRGTLVRLATLRFVAAVVALSGGLLAICTPLVAADRWLSTILPTSGPALAVMMVGAWIVWIPATLTLDNLAWRWLREKK